MEGKGGWCAPKRVCEWVVSWREVKMGCLNGEGGEKGRGLAILQLGEIERVFWREIEGKERKKMWVRKKE